MLLQYDMGLLFVVLVVSLRSVYAIHIYYDENKSYCIITTYHKDSQTFYIHQVLMVIEMIHVLNIKCQHDPFLLTLLASGKYIQIFHREYDHDFLL